MLTYIQSLSLESLAGRMPSSISQGLIWGIMALGVYVTFRILDIADMSVDGTFSTGGAVAVMLIVGGTNPWVAVLVATICGLVVGCVTGVLHTRFGIPAILSGILSQYSLYSINLAIMNFKANQAVSVDKYSLIISSRHINTAIGVGLAFVIVVIGVLYWFFGTQLGSAVRATGCNQIMAGAQGININRMKILGLALSNGIVAMTGALSAQYSGFADVNAGRGAIVIGLAAVIIGEVISEAFFGKKINFGIRMIFIVLGGIIYYIIYSIVLWLKLDPNMMKLFTAIIVAVFLAVPYLKGQSKNSFAKAGKNSKEAI